MKSGAELEKGRNPPVHYHRARGRRIDPRDQLEQRALTGTVPADNPHRLPSGNGEVYPSQCFDPRLGLRPFLAPEPLHELGLEGAVGPGNDVLSEPLCRILDNNRVHIRAGRNQTSSANSSRPRSKIQADTQRSPRETAVTSPKGRSRGNW